MIRSFYDPVNSILSCNASRLNWLILLLASTDGSVTVPIVPPTSKATTDNDVILEKEEAASALPEELFVPGTVYYLKRNFDTDGATSNGRGVEFFTLLKRHPSEHFQRIVLSSNIISGHKCDSHYYALRDVLKGLPGTVDECIFR